MVFVLGNSSKFHELNAIRGRYRYSITASNFLHIFFVSIPGISNGNEVAALDCVNTVDF